MSAAESFLFEWVRDEVLNGNHPELDRYFPDGERRSITEKWKEIPKALASDQKIGAAPNLGGGTAWGDFKKLVLYRNGLLHAGASRPETAGLDEDSLPQPSMEELDGLAPGWAVDVVRRLITELCNAAGKPLPNWL